MKIVKLLILPFLIYTVVNDSNVKPLGFNLNNGFSPMRDSLCQIESIKIIKIQDLDKSRNKNVYFKIDKNTFCSDKSKATSFFAKAVLSSYPRHVNKEGFKHIMYASMGYTLFADSINIKGIDFDLQIFLSPNHSQAETIGAYLSAKNDIIIVNDSKAVIEYKKPQKYLLPISVTGIKLIAKDKDLFRANTNIFTNMLAKKYKRKPHSKDTFICDEETEVSVHPYDSAGSSIEYKNRKLRNDNKQVYSTYLRNKLKNSKNDLSGSL